MCRWRGLVHIHSCTGVCVWRLSRGGVLRLQLVVVLDIVGNVERLPKIFDPGHGGLDGGKDLVLQCGVMTDELFDGGTNQNCVLLLLEDPLVVF